MFGHRAVFCAIFVMVMITRNSFAFLARPNVRTSFLVRNFWPFDKQEDPTGIAIIDAIQSQKEESVTFVIARAGSSLAAVVNEKDPTSGNNAMHIIAKKGHYKFPPAAIPTKLVESGIDVNAKNGKGETALEISLLSGWQVANMIQYFPSRLSTHP